MGLCCFGWVVFGGFGFGDWVCLVFVIGLVGFAGLLFAGFPVR